MGNFCLTIMANALRTYAIYRCMRHFFLKRSEKKLLELSIYLCFICLTSGGYLIFNNMFVNITTNILGLFTITMLYTGDKWKKILMVGLIYIVNIIIESGVLFAFSYNTNTKMMVSVYECITSMGILLLVVILEKTTKGQKDNLQLKSFLQIFLLAVPCASICMVVYNGIVI